MISKKLRSSYFLLLALILTSGIWAITSHGILSKPDLIIDNLAEVQTLDPATANGQQESRLLSFIFEGLTVPHPKTLEPLPGVASSWDISQDGKRYTFHLRPNALWSNGDRVSSQDFVYAWNRLLEPATGSSFAHLLAELKSLETPDEATLIVELKKPVPYFLQNTYLWPLVPIHRASMEAWKKRAPATWRLEWIKPENLIVNGPYQPLFREINSRIRFQKNLNYWDAANVSLNIIDVLALDSATTRLNLFETGQLDWTQQIPISVIPKLLERDAKRKERNGEKNFRPSFYNQAYLGTYLYYFNVTQAPLNDHRIRLALVKSIDRSKITQFITRSGQEPARSLVPPLVPGYETGKAPSFDPDAARKLLAEAGFPEGKVLPALEILYNSNELNRDIAEWIQEEWRRELGIRVKLRNQEWKSFLDAQVTHQYSISRGSWLADYRDPLSFLEIFSTNHGNNRSGFSNEQFDELLKKASEENIAEKRFQILEEAETLLLNEAPVFPLFYYVTSHLVRPGLVGWEANALDMHFPKFWKRDLSYEEAGWGDF